MDTPEHVLRSFEAIAVVGLSRDPQKAAHSVPRALQAAGYRIVPVNPHVETLLGERTFKSLLEVDVPIEIVLVFRPSEEAAEIARQAVQIHAKALWLQLDIRSEAARQIAQAAGLLYVEDRCIAVERSLRRIQKR